MTGLVVVVASCCLLVAARTSRPGPLRLSLVLSLAALLLYWTWLVYLRWGRMDTEASNEVSQSQTPVFAAC